MIPDMARFICLHGGVGLRRDQLLPCVGCDRLSDSKGKAIHSTVKWNGLQWTIGNEKCHRAALQQRKIQYGNWRG